MRSWVCRCLCIWCSEVHVDRDMCSKSTRYRHCNNNNKLCLQYKITTNIENIVDIPCSSMENIFDNQVETRYLLVAYWRFFYVTYWNIYWQIAYQGHHAYHWPCNLLFCPIFSTKQDIWAPGGRTMKYPSSNSIKFNCWRVIYFRGYNIV